MMMTTWIFSVMKLRRTRRLQMSVRLPRPLPRRKKVSIIFSLEWQPSYLLKSVGNLPVLLQFYIQVVSCAQLIHIYTGGKSSVLMDVKPWDDETDMKKLEEAVRSVQMEGLTWGACKEHLSVSLSQLIDFPVTNSLLCCSKACACWLWYQEDDNHVDHCG